jgi:hypothetical protein
MPVNSLELSFRVASALAGCFWLSDYLDLKYRRNSEIQFRAVRVAADHWVGFSVTFCMRPHANFSYLIMSANPKLRALKWLESGI